VVETETDTEAVRFNASVTVMPVVPAPVAVTVNVSGLEFGETVATAALLPETVNGPTPVAVKLAV